MGKVTGLASFALAVGFALSMIVGTTSAAQAQGSYFGQNQGNGFGNGRWARQAANWQGRHRNWMNGNGGFGGGGGHCGSGGGQQNWQNDNDGDEHQHRHHHWQNGMNGINGLPGLPGLPGTTGLLPNMGYPASAYGTGAYGTGAYGNGFIPNPAYGTPYGNGYTPTSGIGSVVGSLLGGGNAGYGYAPSNGALGSLLGGLAPAQAQQVYGY